MPRLGSRSNKKKAAKTNDEDISDSEDEQDLKTKSKVTKASKKSSKKAKKAEPEPESDSDSDPAPDSTEPEVEQKSKSKVKKQSKKSKKAEPQSDSESDSNEPEVDQKNKSKVKKQSKKSKKAEPESESEPESDSSESEEETKKSKSKKKDSDKKDKKNKKDKKEKKDKSETKSKSKKPKDEDSDSAKKGKKKDKTKDKKKDKQKTKSKKDEFSSDFDSDPEIDIELDEPQKVLKPKKANPKKPEVIKAVLPNPLPVPSSSYELNQGFHGQGEEPPFPGSKTLPTGAPGCLANLTFVQTGVLPSTYKEELLKLIESYGGKLTSAISGKTDILIRGCTEVGPSKLDQAKERGIPIVDEDGLFEIINCSNPKYLEEKQKRDEFEALNGPEKLVQMQEANKFHLSPTLFPYSTLFTEKWRPREISEIQSCTEQFKVLDDYLKKYHKNSLSDVGNPNHRRIQMGFYTSTITPKAPVVYESILLVSGQSGIGKSTAVSLACLKRGFRVVEFNGSDALTPQTIRELPTTKFKIINHHMKVDDPALVFDEVDCYEPDVIHEIVEISKDSKMPIICICNNPDLPHLEELCRASSSLLFNEIPESSLTEIRKFVCNLESLSPFGTSETKENPNKYVSKYHFDSRYNLNYIQFFQMVDSGTKRFIEKNKSNIINSTRILMSTTFGAQSFWRLFVAFQAGISEIPLYLEGNATIRPCLNRIVNAPVTKKDLSEERHRMLDFYDSLSEGDESLGCYEDLNEVSQQLVLEGLFVISAAIPASYTNSIPHSHYYTPPTLEEERANYKVQLDMVDKEIMFHKNDYRKLDEKRRLEANINEIDEKIKKRSKKNKVEKILVHDNPKLSHSDPFYDPIEFTERVSISANKTAVNSLLEKIKIEKNALVTHFIPAFCCEHLAHANDDRKKKQWSLFLKSYKLTQDDVDQILGLKLRSCPRISGESARKEIEKLTSEAKKKTNVPKPRSIWKGTNESDSDADDSNSFHFGGNAMPLQMGHLTEMPIMTKKFFAKSRKH